MLDVVFEALPGLVVPFVFRLAVPPLLALAVGIALVVWSARMFRRSSVVSALIVITLGVVLVLVVPAFTTFFAAKYAGAAVVASAIGKGREVTEWVVSSGLTAVGRDMGLGELTGSLDSRALLGHIAGQRAGAESQLVAVSGDQVYAMVSSGSLDAATLARLSGPQVPVVLEYAFWRVLEETVRSQSVTGRTITWNGLAEDVAKQLNARAQGLMSGIQQTFSSAALSALLIILALNFVAVLGSILTTVLLCRSRSAPTSSPF